jgi:hypothetical protein
MKTELLKKNILFNGFTLLVALVCLLTILLNTINGRFWLSDFHVYYSAAQNFLSGGQVYLVSFDSGSGFYKYSPVMLLFFLPFCIFSFKAASIIYFILLSIIFWYAFILIRDLLKLCFFRYTPRKEYVLLSLSFIPVVIFLSRELFLGNINILILMLCCLAAKRYLSGKDFAASLFISIAIIAKPYFLLLLIPLVIRRKWKALFWVVLFLSAGMAIPFLLTGPSKSIQLYTDWFNTMLIHDNAFPSRNSLEYILQYYVSPSLPGFVQYLILAIVCASAVLFIRSNIAFEKKHEVSSGFQESNFYFEWFVLIALLPNLVKADWVQFLLSAPIIAFIIFSIARLRRYWLIPVLVILIFFFGANSDDLMGRALSHQLFIMGLMGISNVLLILMSFYLFLDYRKKRDRELSNQPDDPE